MSQRRTRARAEPYPSEEARFLRRLAEGPEMPAGTSEQERAAARGEWAGEVEAAANELGGQWAAAYQELHPEWQPSPTDIEISNRRAAELTAAREQITRLETQMAVARQGFEEVQREHMFHHDDYGASIPLQPLRSTWSAALLPDNALTHPINTRVEFTLLGVTQQGTVTSPPDEYGLQDRRSQWREVRPYPFAQGF